MPLAVSLRSLGRGAVHPTLRALGGALAFFALHSSAQASPAGPYEASAAQLTVKVGTWGDDCGPRPTSHTEPGGATRVSQEGSALLIALPDRAIRTDTCWTPNPAVRVASATGGGDSFRVECKTQANDAKKETGRYTLTIAPSGVISLYEESNYDWQLKTSHCVASVKRVQTLTPGAAVVTPAPKPGAEKPAACVPGALAKVRLKPAEARVSPGKRVCFQVVGVDAAGCTLKNAPAHGALALASAGAALGSVSGMCFTADGRTASSGSTRVSLEAQGLRAEATVRVLPADLAAITAEGGDEAEGLDDAEASDGVFDAGVRAVVAGTGGHPWLAAVLLALAIALIAYGVRRRREKLAHSQLDLEAVAPRIRKPSVDPSAAAEPWLCPRCRRGYPAGTTRCAVDGETPIPYAEYKRRLDAQSSSGPTPCPNCGSPVAADAAFCGVCGRARPARTS